jgi:hypothetical protein
MQRVLPQSVKNRSKTHHEKREQSRFNLDHIAVVRRNIVDFEKCDRVVPSLGQHVDAPQ